MINVLYEDNHVIVVEKKINIPICADESHDLDMLTMVKEYLKEKYNKPGNVYLGLVHRLDRPVGGIVVFAKTSKAASRLSEQVREKNLQKKYYAVIIGDIKHEGILKDKLLKDKKNNIVKVDEKGKESLLEYKVIAQKEGMSLVDINLITGRSHQIRVQFSSRGCPLYGDNKYNSEATPGEQIALFAYSLSFIHPVTKEKMVFKMDKPSRYPFNIF